MNYIKKISTISAFSFLGIVLSTNYWVNSILKCNGSISFDLRDKRYTVEKITSDSDSYS